MNILFVCTGNTCRSIMAELIFKEKLLEKYGEGSMESFNIDSAGIMADGVSVISSNANKVLEEHYNKKFDASRKCKLFDSKNAENYDIILTVTERHKIYILDNFNLQSNSVFTISEFVGESYDIEDPYMGDISIYRKTFTTLDSLLNKLIDKLSDFGG